MPARMWLFNPEAVLTPRIDGPLENMLNRSSLGWVAMPTMMWLFNLGSILTTWSDGP